MQTRRVEEPIIYGGYILIFFASLYILFLLTIDPQFLEGIQYEVHITNSFTTNSSVPLVVWCTSQQVDLGGRGLQEGDEFSWRHKAGLWINSDVSCTMKWEEKRKKFNPVPVHRDRCRSGRLKICFWSVREDGFYFGNDEVVWTKVFSWP